MAQNLTVMILVNCLKKYMFMTSMNLKKCLLNNF